MIPHTLGIWIRTGIDRIFITKLYGTAEAGLYATGFQFGLLMTFLIMAFHNAYTPYIYKLLADKNNDRRHRIVKFTYAYFAAVLVLAFIFTLTSVFIIKYFLSKQYVASTKYVGWAMFAQAFQGMYFMVGIYIFYAKKTGNLAIATTIIALIQLILSYLLIKYIGPMGAAYCSCIIGFLNFLIVWFFSNRAFSMPWFNFGTLKNE
jgi:O-antigen/teichoic acid export membrane protein